MMVLMATPMVSTNWSKKARCTSLNRLKRGQLDHAEDLVLEEDRQHGDARRRRLSRDPIRP